MTDLSLRDDLAQRLQQIARREHRRLDEVIETLLNQYDNEMTRNLTTEDELREDRLRIYDRARRYWQGNGDSRQHLTTGELDQQFWLVDAEGIPRLKEDQAVLDLPTDALARMLEMAEADQTVLWKSATNESENTKDVLNTAYTDYLLSRLKRPIVPDE